MSGRPKASRPLAALAPQRPPKSAPPFRARSRSRPPGGGIGRKGGGGAAAPPLPPPAERPRPRAVGGLRGGRARPPAPPPPPPSDLGAVRVVAMWGEGGEGGADEGGKGGQVRASGGPGPPLDDRRGGVRRRARPPIPRRSPRPRSSAERVAGGGECGARRDVRAAAARQRRTERPSGPPLPAAVGAPRAQPPRPRARAVHIMFTFWRAVLKSAGK